LAIAALKPLRAATFGAAKTAAARQYRPAITGGR
jgi:hypothetical protein